jgi:hypothetical protein
MDKNGRRRAVPGEREMTAKPTSIKGIGGKSGGRAWKAVDVSPGDLLHVTES